MKKFFKYDDGLYTAIVKYDTEIRYTVRTHVDELVIVDPARETECKREYEDFLDGLNDAEYLLCTSSDPARAARLVGFTPISRENGELFQQGGVQ